MLNFINTLVLPLLAAALIPLLLHLFNRQKLKIVPFSSLRFLKELQSKRLRQIKVYRILIILLRMLFIIFLVLTFARPTVRHLFGEEQGKARTTGVIILDNSYSMQTQHGMQSFFDRAREALKTILRSFDKRDHVTLLLPQADSLHQYVISPEHPLPWKRIKARNFTPDFSIALFRAAQIFEQFPNYNRELYLITDENIPAKTLNDSAKQVLRRLKARIYLINAASKQAVNNISIDSAAVESQLVEVHKPLIVSATLQNHTSETKQVTLSLFEQTTRLAMQSVTLPAQATRKARLYFSPDHDGFFPLKLEIDDDDLLIDNTYYLSLFIPKVIPVLYVQNRTPLELREALNTLSAKTNLKIKQSDYDRWYGEPLSEYRLLILNDPPQITPTFVLHLKRYLQSGNSVILIPGMKLTPADYNHLTQALIGQNLFKELIKIDDAQRFFSLSVTVDGNALLNDLFSEKPKGNIWPPFFQYFKLSRVGTILMRFDNGDPFLCRLATGKGNRLWLFGAGLTMPWSTFPLNGLFLPFLHRIIRLAANIKTTHSHFTVGKPVIIYLNKTVARGNFTLLPPDGTPMTIIPKETPRGLSFVFDGFDRPGHYKIFQDKKLVRLLALNLSSEEWARPYVNFKKLRNDIRLLAADRLSAKALKTARSGQELWPYFLLMALLMFFLEMVFIRKLEGNPQQG